jgi:hypothetical protein
MLVAATDPHDPPKMGPGATSPRRLAPVESAQNASLLRKIRRAGGIAIANARILYPGERLGSGTLCGECSFGTVQGAGNVGIGTRWTERPGVTSGERIANYRGPYINLDSKMVKFFAASYLVSFSTQ